MKRIVRPSHDPFMMGPVEYESVTRNRTTFSRYLRMGLGLCLAGSLSAGLGGAYGSNAASGSGSGGGGNTNVSNGTYIIRVAGFFTGPRGQASVGGGKVHISVNVTDDAGNSGLMRADVILSSNRFKGAGTIIGKPMTIEGRVDSADQRRARHNQVQIGPRIVATFQSNDGHRGRIFGQPDHAQRPD